MMVPWSDLVPIPDQYKKAGCLVEDTALRGITLEKLEELLDLIRQVLDAGYEITDRFSGETVNLDSINLYHIDEHFVKPLTEKEQCSFAELVSTERVTKPPIFMVSHYWGTSLVDTIRMLKLHRHASFSIWDARTERWKCRRNRTYSVWICAFSNRQHSLDQEGIDTPTYMQTPFARVISSEHCLGTVMLLDEIKATPLQRSWCIFEAFVSIAKTTHKRKRHRLDIATIIPEGSYRSGNNRSNLRCAGILSETHLLSFSGGDRLGFRTTDHPDPRNFPDDEGTRICKPGSFPVEVALRGMQVNILDAQATQPVDQERIRMWVGSNANQVNQTLREKFLSVALQGSCKTCDPTILTRTLELACSRFSRQVVIDTLHDLQVAVILFNKRNEADLESAQCTKALVDIGWNPNKPMKPEMLLGSTLCMAIRREQYETTRVLLDAGADPNILRPSELFLIVCATLGDDFPQEIETILCEKVGILKKCVVGCLFGCLPCTMCCMFCGHYCSLLNPCYARNNFRSLIRSYDDD
ncbi:expressed unknown protein [Seminavis robusta]|uniref:Uncharacterized protein n=1 Tax=Seminavis robusta TaxID=568900 RepID=A0A9N8D9Y0_9STRA|nr:expressed unknown protein [Seminavis robusta]|eukprot:Sro7_g006100.1 n/a (526) ;mRNA; r:152860-154437